MGSFFQSGMKKLKDYEIMELFPTQPVADPQVSPDGTRVLFTYSTVNMEDDKYDTHIWLLPLKERRPRQFTFGKENATNSRWSPDGGSILFTSNRPGEGDKEEDEKKKAQLFVIPADGGEARQLTRVEGGVQRPAWSPDGRNILFVSPVFKGEKATEDSDVKIIRRMIYKPDGKGFQVGQFSHLFVVPARGGRAKQLTDGEYHVDAASWSPDGKAIAFIANMDEDADMSFYKNIYTVPAKGGDPELLWEGFGRIGALQWSPDGRYIAFTGREIEDPSLVWHKNTELWVLLADGGEPKCLTAGFDRTVSRVQKLKWSPDSKYVYATFPTYGTSHI